MGNEWGTDEDQAAYRAAHEPHELRPPVYPWYVRAWGWLRWKLRM